MEAAVACDWEHTHKTRSGYLSDEGVREDTVPPTKRACPEAPSYGDTPSECTELVSRSPDRYLPSIFI